MPCLGSPLQRGHVSGVNIAYLPRHIHSTVLSITLFIILIYSLHYLFIIFTFLLNSRKPVKLVRDCIKEIRSQLMS